MNKTVKRMTMVLLVITPLMVVLAFAQARQPGHERTAGMNRGEERSERMIPDMTEEQKEEMKQLRLKSMEESLPLRNQLNENKARYRTLSTATNVDMRAINKLVDESGKIETELKKKAAANHQQIRMLLTDEQRVIFDSRPGRSGERMSRERKMRSRRVMKEPRRMRQELQEGK